MRSKTCNCVALQQRHQQHKRSFVPMESMLGVGDPYSTPLVPASQNDVPPPGAYFRRSTLERDGRVCGSVSAKGYGTGFVSTAPRFKDLKTLQQAFLPGPGSYATQSEGAPEGGKLTSFSSLKRVRFSCQVWYRIGRPRVEYSRTRSM